MAVFSVSFMSMSYLEDNWGDRVSGQEFCVEAVKKGVRCKRAALKRLYGWYLDCVI
jgi:hypothetical protein